MQVELINPEESPISLDFFSQSVEFVKKSLIQKKVIPSSFNKKLIITFVSEDSMKDLNNTFLNKNYTTDVLSFAPMEKEYLGELALSEEKIRSQCVEHNLTFEEETIYLVLHGVLHLLGFHHEEGGEAARKMFEIQDCIFQEWQNQFKGG